MPPLEKRYELLFQLNMRILKRFRFDPLSEKLIKYWNLLKNLVLSDQNLFNSTRRSNVNYDRRTLFSIDTIWIGNFFHIN